MTSTTPPLGPVAARIVLAIILTLAAALRLHAVGRASYWYDEVVSVRLGTTPGPSALIARLDQTDATRAPLHPLILQAWVRGFGPSEFSTRLLSALCGVLTVWVVFQIARSAYGDEASGLWASALCAVSPLMVVYSRETRMYAWLVLATTLTWWALFAITRRPTRLKLAAYAAGLVAIAFSHPLGLLMGVALGVASLVAGRWSWANWVWPHLAAGALIAPWVPRYLDHDPEYAVGVVPWKFLFGTPIGFLGGNFMTLAAFLLVIAFGAFRRNGRPENGPGAQVRLEADHPQTVVSLVLWLTLAPTLLYLYSRLSHPVFGPARYTLFVAPAYFLLLGRGLARLPLAARLPAAAIAIGLAAWSLPGTVYAPDLKADWRAAADYLAVVDPSSAEPVVVFATDPTHNVETVTAAFYLDPRRPVLLGPTGSVFALPAGRTWLAVGLRGGRAVAPLPTGGLPDGPHVDFAGLRLVPMKALP